MLHVRRFGTGPPLLALHGFTLSGEQFAALAEPLQREILAPDLPGHGQSADAPTDVDRTVSAVIGIAEVEPVPPPILGYSQGARVAILACLEQRSAFSSLITISGTAGIDVEQDRRNRITQDDALAARIELFGMERFLDEWTSTGITSTSDLPEAQRALDRAIRDENTPGGLAAALRGYGQGMQPVAWDRLGEMDLPVLVVAGERDDTYRQIATRLADALPKAELAVIPDAGHDPLRDRPEPTVEVISGFLDGLG